MNNKIKLILCDLDDTLMTSKKEVLPKTREALLECSRRGMMIGYVTIRSPRKTGIYTKGLPCDCLANYNGAMIWVKDQIIGNYSIPHNTGRNLIQSLQVQYPGLSIGAYFEPLCYYNGEIRVAGSQEITDYTLSGVPPYDFQRIRIVPGEYNPDMIVSTGEELSYTVTVHNSIIITHSRANKENAVQRLMEHFHLQASEVLSFGDDYVDLGMLRASGTGVAMGNAVQELKAAADYVTLTNEEEGIADYLNRFVL
jgi:hydroxymethylpyrimidine pyrophosphatase-like HAD family hydrolase